MSQIKNPITKEEIALESSQHSFNPCDWTNEALIKEVLWAQYQMTAQKIPMCPNRYVIALNEMKKRIQELQTKLENKNIDINFIFTCLLYEQMNVAKCSTTPRNKRDNYLEQFEKAFQVINPTFFVSRVTLP